MKRRKAIQQIGLGVSAGFMLPAWLSSCKDFEPTPLISYDGTIGIIGAGAAGLLAADILMASGVKVKVFEASNRVGGRIENLHPTDLPTDALLYNPENFPNSDFPTELGAERVLGTDSRWAKVISELKIPTVEINTLGTDNYFMDGAFAEGETLSADVDFIAAKQFVIDLSTYSGSNVSVQEAIQNAGINSRVHAILNSWLGNTYGTSNDRLGIAGLIIPNRNTNQLTLKQNPMEDVLLSKFSAVVPSVQLNTAIQNINYTGEKIVLTGIRNGGESFTEEVNKVIVTVPLSILKTGDITFSPSLSSSKTTALSRMDMDACIRLVLEFKGNFWGTSSSFLFGGTQAPEYFNTGIGRSESNRTMNITIAGAKAEALSAMGNEMIPIILMELDSIFAGKATQNIRTDNDGKYISVIQDWTKEPYIKGGTAYVKTGGSNEDRINLAASVDEKLFFAGEATDVTGEFGTINGALLSAERAAQEVIDAIT